MTRNQRMILLGFFLAVLVVCAALALALVDQSVTAAAVSPLTRPPTDTPEATGTVVGPEKTPTEEGGLWHKCLPGGKCHQEVNPGNKEGWEPGPCGTCPPGEETETPTCTAVPPTNTPKPTHTPHPTHTPRPTHTPTEVAPTATSVPPTATSVPPTATGVPPTATSVPPTSTSVPPTVVPTPLPPPPPPVVFRQIPYGSAQFWILNKSSHLVEVHAGQNLIVLKNGQALNDMPVSPGNPPTPGNVNCQGPLGNVSNSWVTVFGWDGNNWTALIQVTAPECQTTGDLEISVTDSGVTYQPVAGWKVVKAPAEIQYVFK